MLLAAPLLAAFVAAAVAPLAYRRWPRATYAGAVALAVAALLVLLAHAPAVARGESVTGSLAWIPSLGIAASLRLDALALLFALAIVGVGALVLAYAGPYVRWEHEGGRLLAYLLAFLGSMLGLVLADDAITLFVFWELTSVVSFLLIAIEDTEQARSRARQALLVTSAGGLFLLIGLLLLAAAASPGAELSATLSALASSDVRAHADYAAIVLLVAIGSFTKSAQVPFHFWLPSAMVAPTPVSAYLHSATMVKAGVYVLARLHPALGGTALWTDLLGTVGAVTFAIGGLLAAIQRELKLVLAYATIAVLGALVMLLGLGTNAAIEAALLLFAAHVAYKAALFLVAGNVAHRTGAHDPVPLRGLARALPVTCVAALAAAASMAGIPPLLGFVAKDAVLAAGLDSMWPVALAIAGVVAASGLVAAAWLVGIGPFVRRARERSEAHDVPAAMWTGPLVLAALGLGVGVAPGLLLQPLADAAAAAIAGHPVAIHLELWPGLYGSHGSAFALGLLSLALGSTGYALVLRRHAAVDRVRELIGRIAGERVYDAAMHGLQRGADVVTRTIQHGRLHGYVLTVVAAAVVAVLGAALALGHLEPPRATVRLGIHEAPLAALVVIGVFATAIVRDRLAAIAALGTAGLAVAFLFALFSGPDLAITQLTVETMLLILLVLVARRLPRRARGRGRRRVVHAAVAGVAGAGLAALLLLATAIEAFEPAAAREHVALARSQHSENVVNAILVNFRAIDTLGEITVLTTAAIGVVALLRGRRR